MGQLAEPGISRETVFALIVVVVNHVVGRSWDIQTNNKLKWYMRDGILNYS